MTIDSSRNERLVDSNVLSYLRRAQDILEKYTDQPVKKGSRLVIEVAKIVQSEQSDHNNV